MMQYNPKEVGVDKAVPWQKARAAFSVRVDGPGFRTQAGLLLPANTRSAQGRFDDADIVHVLNEGFGLRLAQTDRARFVTGASLASLLLVPAVEAVALHKPGDRVRAWQMSGVSVRAARSTAHGYEVWNQPLRIIAILIGL